MKSFVAKRVISLFVNLRCICDWICWYHSKKKDVILLNNFEKLKISLLYMRYRYHSKAIISYTTALNPFCDETLHILGRCHMSRSSSERKRKQQEQIVFETQYSLINSHAQFLKYND